MHAQLSVLVNNVINYKSITTNSNHKTNNCFSVRTSYTVVDESAYVVRGGTYNGNMACTLTRIQSW